jgi:hypothetical protein
MDDAGEHGHHSSELSGGEGTVPGQLPYWKRAHHDWRFWGGLCLMFAAVAIYILSGSLALLPLGIPRQPPPSRPQDSPAP